MRGRTVTLLLLAGSLLAVSPADAHRRHHHFPAAAAVALAWGGLWYWPHWYVAGAVTPARVSSEVAGVDTDVEPEHARVYLDGELIGVADDFDGFPGYLLLKPGSYTLEFRLPGYHSETVEIEARPGRFFPLEMSLKRNPGERSAPWYERPAKPPVDEVFGPPKRARRESQGTANPRLRPELRDGRDKADNERRPAPEAAPSESEEKAGEEAPAPTQAKRGAALELKVTPAHASVYLDGEFLGTGAELGRLERGAAVSAGRHRLAVLAPGHIARELEIELAAGARLQVVVELEAGTGQTK
ncbi:MAG: hypothetical protein V1750_01725 [Acidobacteriota bacterium]